MFASVSTGKFEEEKCAYLSYTYLYVAVVVVGSHEYKLNGASVWICIWL